MWRIRHRNLYWSDMGWTDCEKQQLTYPTKYEAEFISTPMGYGIVEPTDRLVRFKIAINKALNVSWFKED